MGSRSDGGEGVAQGREESPLQAFEKMGSSYGILVLFIGESNWMFRIKLEKLFYSCNFSKNPLLKRIWKHWSLSFSERRKKKETQTKTMGKTVKVLGEKKNSKSGLVWFSDSFQGEGISVCTNFFQLSVFKDFMTDSLHTSVLYWGSLWSFAVVCSCLKRSCLMITGKGLSGSVCFSCKINSILLYLAFPSGTPNVYIFCFLYCTFSVQKLLDLFVCSVVL